MDLTDLSVFYADFAVPVTHVPSAGPAVSGRALFDQPGTVMLGGDVLATELSVRFPAGVFDVRRGDRFEIEGGSYVARQDGQPAAFDGRELIVPLGRA